MYIVEGDNYNIFRHSENIISNYSLNYVRLSILDLSGRYIFRDIKFELTESTVVLDISYLKGGIYLLEAADKVLSRKVKIVKAQ